MSQHTNRNKHFRKIATCTNAGLAMFLVTGLTGCSDTPDDCKNISNLPQKQLEECKQRGYTSTSSHGGGVFFLPSSSYNNSSYSPNHSGYGGVSESTSSKSGGFFSSSGSSHGSSVSSGG